MLAITNFIQLQHSRGGVARLVQQDQELEQEHVKLQEELSKKDVELHESARVIMEEREHNVVPNAKLAEAIQVAEGLREKVAAKTKALQQKEVELGEFDLALKQKEVGLEEKTQAMASLPRQIKEAREVDSPYLWTTFNRAPDTDFCQFVLVALEQVQV